MNYALQGPPLHLGPVARRFGGSRPKASAQGSQQRRSGRLQAAFSLFPPSAVAPRVRLSRGAGGRARGSRSAAAQLPSRRAPFPARCSGASRAGSNSAKDILRPLIGCGHGGGRRPSASRAPPVRRERARPERARPEPSAAASPAAPPPAPQRCPKLFARRVRCGGRELRLQSLW